MEAMKPHVLAALACALPLLLSAPAGADGLSGKGTFIAFTDPHFDPLRDPSVLGALEAAEPKDWEAILERSGVSDFGAYGRDAPWPLVKSALDAMAAADPKPDFVLFLGDLVAHHLRESYFAYDARPTETRYAAFLGKTAAFMAMELGRRFPGAPILPVLGNNDADCGDYSPEPDGPALAAYAAAWKPLVGPQAETFAATFRQGGYYSIAHPTVPKRRIVVLDDTFLSEHYRACGDGTADPGRRQLDWLKGELDSAAARGEKVWLLLHIPVGIDVWATLRRGACLLPPQPMLEAKYAPRLLRILRDGASALQSLWSGHIHMDDGRLLPGAPPVLDKVVPGVSPIFGNNPAFQVYAYDPGDGAIRDYRTWILPGLDAGKPPVWRVEYTFSQAYGLTRVDGAAMAALAGRLPGDADTRRLYQTYYASSDVARSAITPGNWRAYWCGIGNVTPPAFQACYCGGPR